MLAFFWLFFGEPLTKWCLSCMALIAGGLASICMSGMSESPIDSHAVLWLIAAMLLYSVGIINLRIPQTHGMPSLPIIV